jgi:hypothetical protein
MSPPHLRIAEAFQVSLPTAYRDLVDVSLSV